MPRRSLVLLAIFTFFGVTTYVLTAAWLYRPGFPLDDSWIHLTYARNLALRGEWSFLPGQNSAGSTAPLWTFLLAVGFFLRISPYVWAYFLGGVMFFLLAWRIEFTLRRMQPAYTSIMPWAGLLVLGEWHLAWASASGMEILLHALIITMVISMLILGDPRFLLMGLLAGLSIWSRPDGLTLLGPLGLFAVLYPKTNRQKVSAAMRVLLGFVALFGPYLLFNLLLADTPWPNTFYAKQAEYAVWQAQPVFTKLSALLGQYFSGVTLALIPAVVLLLVKAAQKRGWGILLAFVWLAGYAWLYVSRLPLYQYGRYIMPTIPVFLLLALIFLFFWLPVVRTRVQRYLRFAWLASIALLGIVLWAYGAYLYAKNVAWVESEMVQTAYWVKQNLPSDTLVAAHDIGALGYFSGLEQVVDLAGLISPQVVPFMLDESRLLVYLQNQGATNIIVFPEWYPGLVKDCLLVYEADGRYAGQNPQGILSVYECQKP
ncbi:MAG: hypothetical protein CVU44_05135 [Chloroflexi bacterium HGW-Chloroflexi-6]|nr:MAG: hypothetical protein CVU44_05135 [Chloroflexi bacterium HGW-Chloroflexi-6]